MKVGCKGCEWKGKRTFVNYDKHRHLRRPCPKCGKDVEEIPDW